MDHSPIVCAALFGLASTLAVADGRLLATGGATSLDGAAAGGITRIV